MSNKEQTVILIDGDVLAYEAGFTSQYPVEWEEDLPC
jgi:hypothetical protein